MFWQHSMASAGVVIPEQSTTYAPRAIARNATKNVLPRCIYFKLNAKEHRSQGAGQLRLSLDHKMNRRD